MNRGPLGWQDKARAMKAADPTLTQTAIAEALGVTSGAVCKALNPERAREWQRIQNVRRAPMKRAWDRDPLNRGWCRRCGALLGQHAKYQNKSGLCRDCRVFEWNWDRAIAEDVLITMARAGCSHRKIAEALGWTVATVNVRQSQLRAGGVTVPYRKEGNRRNFAALHERRRAANGIAA